MKRGRTWWASALVVATACASAPRAPEGGDAARLARPRLAEIAGKVAGLEHRAGLFELYLDRLQNRVLAVLPAPSGARGVLGEYLYIEGLRTGLGSNPVGLDRGQLGDGVALVLRRVGSRVLFEQPNLRHRSLGSDAAETAAVAESFATSVLWATDVLAEDAAGRSLVDLTGFLLRDAHGVASRLADTGQGAFALDRERSVVDLESCFAFPKNVELESILTFSGAAPGPEILAVAPDPRAVTVVLHQSLIELPAAGYRPREHDPRMGSIALRFADYSAPLERPLTRRWALRHRLHKRNPAAERSPAEEPIVYYVDRGAPEPVRSALVEGASWWVSAFEAAGFEGGFRVELLPADADPLDARYNVIQWVHRATRGWSYGQSIVDPRTGEILKGHVTLGSLRIRQDRLLFEGLAGVGRTGTGAADDPVQLSLARIRQLAAHEVGHTLGLEHNFAASSYGRASVMDYPAPLVQIAADGTLDFSEAYARGVGEWDVEAVRWAYAEFPPGADERERLAAIVRESIDRGLVFLTEGDARSPSGAHPLASLWDNGAEPVAALQLTLRVRRIALARFGEGNLAPGEPLAALHEVFVPVYLHHRFQLVAAAKLLGGVDYRHALDGDGQPAPRWVGGERQRRALAVLLDTLAPSFLDVPENALRVLVPRAPGMERSREQLGERTRPVFDALGAAATAADLTLRAVLDPVRAARLVDGARRTGTTPDFSEVLSTVIDRVFADTSQLLPREAEIARVVQRVLVDRLFELASDADAAPWVTSRTELALSLLLQRVDEAVSLDAAESAHFDALAAEIGRHLARPLPPRAATRSALPEPPGEPIGSAPGLAECEYSDGP